MDELHGSERSGLMTSTAAPQSQSFTITLVGTHGETLTITYDFEPHGVLDGELLVRVNGPKGASKYQFTTSRKQVASLLAPEALEVGEAEGPAGLADLANSLGVSELDLDEYVHDLASKPASDINNSGLASQIAYLTREAGPAEAERIIREAAAAGGNKDGRS
jgi:hypothetical protein